MGTEPQADRSLAAPSFRWWASPKGYYLDYEAKVVDGSEFVEAFRDQDKQAFPFDSDVQPIERTGPFVVDFPAWEKPQYDPFSDDPGLFLKFASLRTTTEILDFASKYGNLRRGVPLRTTIHAGIDEDIIQGFHAVGADGEYYDTGVSLEYWRKQIFEMRLRVGLWAHLTSDVGREGVLPYLIHQLPEGGPYQYTYTLFDEDELPERIRAIDSDRPGALAYAAVRGYLSRFDYPEIADISPDDTTALGWVALQQEINLCLDRHAVRIRIQGARPDSFTVSFVPDDLIGCLWVQFARAVLGVEKFKQCKVCKRWESPKTAGARNFEKWEGHVECLAADRTRRKRERQERVIRLWRSGMPLEEIERDAQAAGARPGSATKWIEEAKKDPGSWVSRLARKASKGTKKTEPEPF